MKRFFALVSLAFLITTTPARADVRLSFSPDGTPTNFTVLVGNSISVPVYVLQDGGTNILTTDGLASGGVRLNFTNSISGGATLNSSIANPGFTVNASGFPQVSSGPAGGFGAVSSNVGLNPRLTPPGGTNSILVGNFNFTGNITDTVVSLATSNPHSSSFAEFTTGAIPGPPPLTVLEQASFGQIFWPNGTVPGGFQPANSATVIYNSTITVVPEPTTILGLCAAVGGVMAWQKKRKARKNAAQ